MSLRGKKNTSKKEQYLELQESLSLQNNLPLRPAKNIFELLIKVLLVTAQSVVIAESFQNLQLLEGRYLANSTKPQNIH